MKVINRVLKCNRVKPNMGSFKLPLSVPRVLAVKFIVLLGGINCKIIETRRNRENVKDFEDFIIVSATFSEDFGEVLDEILKVFNTFQ